MRRYVFGLLLLSACGRFGFSDDAIDAGDADLGDPTLSHITFEEEGWTVEVFYDFSMQFLYSAQEFIDGGEVYDNLPLYLFALRAPYPEALCVVAGRELLVIDGQTMQRHDFGNHASNQPDLPDSIRMGLWASNVSGGGPGVVIASSSDQGGDGVFSISTQWVSTTLNPMNNVRAFAWDETGTFDGIGVPEGYMATSSNVRRFSDDSGMFPGDTKSMIVRGAELYITRTILEDVDVRLIRVGSFSVNMYPEIELAQSAEIRIGEGLPAGGGFAWVLFDDRRLSRIAANNTLESVAASTDDANGWYGAVTPPPGHPLAEPNVVYILESNTAEERFRVLRLRGPT